MQAPPALGLQATDTPIGSLSPQNPGQQGPMYGGALTPPNMGTASYGQGQGSNGIGNGWIGSLQNNQGQPGQAKFKPFPSGVNPIGDNGSEGGEGPRPMHNPTSPFPPAADSMGSPVSFEQMQPIIDFINQLKSRGGGMGSLNSNSGSDSDSTPTPPSMNFGGQRQMMRL